MFKKTIALLVIITAIYASYKSLLPSDISTLDSPKNEFSTARALVHLDAIAQQPHYLGHPEHETVRNYIVNQLEKLGLDTQIQEGFTMSKWGNLAKPKNIIARIKGSDSNKALLLMSHYDSNPHSSIGASDAGSGVVTILEGIRAFIAEGKIPKNDIIILISDAEELGLNGAELFVNQHEWAKNIGLVLNFEARGSGGPSYMLIETNQGNANLMKEFVAANPKFPVANSLAYSIYKMLPNDTDLTVFRRDGNIDGFNFAFIDDHFDYHTALDTYSRLDRNSLEHQGSYLMPLLHHFSNANLENLKSEDDFIYFNTPFTGTNIYPFSWIMPMLIIAILLFIGLLIYGFKNKILNPKDTLKGSLAFIASLSISGLVSFFGWKLVLVIYPEYFEILQGFPYNGHTYIFCFVAFTLAICFYCYHKFQGIKNIANILVAPLLIWLILSAVVAVKLQGASFFIIPVYFALLSFFILLRQQQPSLLLLTLLSVPLLFIFAPLVKMFPVGLGLKIIVVSAIFCVLIFGFTLPVFGFFKHKKRWASILFFLGIIFFFKAHFNSEFTPETPKPNSLNYVLDADSQSATWQSYDLILDSWTENFLGKDPTKINTSKQNNFGSKYATAIAYTKSAPLKDIPQPKIEISNDTIINGFREFNICIVPERPVQRIEVFADSTNQFKSFKINGVDAYKKEDENFVFTERKNNRLFSYFVSDEIPLEMQIRVPEAQKTTFLLYEASFDLLDNDLFTIPKREENMIPKPFVLNDAVIVKKQIVIE